MKNLIFKIVSGLILAILILQLTVIAAHAQTPLKTPDKVLKDTVIKQVSYKLYIGSRGGTYILVTSAKGLVYKKYLKAVK